jgi:Na+/H+ antiporter NhaD/arsenite permease-like protein
VKSCVVPSVVCLVVPLAVLSFRMRGEVPRPAADPARVNSLARREQELVFTVGVLALVFVPVFKTVTHLPPFMGMLFSLGTMWVLTERIHHKKDESDKDRYSVLHALRKIDASSILFFLGILLCIATLETTGMLPQAAAWLGENVPSVELIVVAIGLLSSIVDNVPLVAASMGMYDLTQFPTNSFFWTFMAYCAGTGGSALIIGSAAGVAAMGIEKINFIWYIKKITLLALIGYFAGAAAYIIQFRVLGF